MAKPPRLKANGEPDMRGHADGSKRTRLAPGDGRRRPGRPKGAKDERTLVRLIQNMTVPINMPGLPKRINTQFACLLKLREKALRGDLRAIEMLDRKLGQHAPPYIEPNLTEDLLAEDAEILRDAERRGSVPDSCGPSEDMVGSQRTHEADDLNQLGDEQ